MRRCVHFLQGVHSRSLEDRDRPAAPAGDTRDMRDMRDMKDMSDLSEQRSGRWPDAYSPICPNAAHRWSWLSSSLAIPWKLEPEGREPFHLHPIRSPLAAPPRPKPPPKPPKPPHQGHPPVPPPEPNPFLPSPPSLPIPILILAPGNLSPSSAADPFPRSSRR